MEGWIRVVLLPAGGALGVNARDFTGMWGSRWAGQQYPWSTFAINVTGSFAIGLLAIFADFRGPQFFYSALSFLRSTSPDFPGFDQF